MDQVLESFGSNLEAYLLGNQKVIPAPLFPTVPELHESSSLVLCKYQHAYESRDDLINLHILLG